MGLVFDDVVGIVEVINCKDVKLQVCILLIGPRLLLCFIFMYLHTVNFLNESWCLHFISLMSCIISCVYAWLNCVASSYIPRSWVKSPPSPSTRPTVAMFT